MGSDKSINSGDLPEKEVFETKEPYQYPQPADWGKAINREDKNAHTTDDKERVETNKTEGLNEEKTDGKADAFEGFEDMDTD